MVLPWGEKLIEPHFRMVNSNGWG